MNEYKKPSKMYVIGLIALLIIAIAAFWLKKIDKTSTSPPIDTSFTIDYENTKTHSTQFRYKYILTYETVDTLEAPNNWNYNEPLFVLIKKDLQEFEGGTEVAKAYLSRNEDNASISVISDPFSIEPNKAINDLFEVKVHPETDIRDKIKFEVEVILEELIEDNWHSVYTTELSLWREGFIY